jgi:anti-sigma-K factor RskA
MREAFAERLQADRPVSAVRAPNPEALPARVRSSRYAWPRTLPWVAAFVVALGGWATAYQLHQANIQSQQVLNLLASGNHVALSASDSTYRAVLSVNRATAVVWAESLPALPPGHLYEGWWIIGGRPVRAGMFSRTPRVLKVPIAQHPAEFAVTIEPARGTNTPTTPVLVAGALPV